MDEPSSSLPASWPWRLVVGAPLAVLALGLIAGTVLLPPPASELVIFQAIIVAPIFHLVAIGQHRFQAQWNEPAVTCALLLMIGALIPTFSVLGFGFENFLIFCIIAGIALYLRALWIRDQQTIPLDDALRGWGAPAKAYLPIVSFTLMVTQCTLGGGADGGTLILLLLAIFAAVSYFRSLHRTQRLRQSVIRAASNEEILARLHDNADVPLFLYLRSFARGRSTIFRRVLFPFKGSGVSLFDRVFGVEPLYVEEDLGTAIGQEGYFVAIGDTRDSYGSAKILTTDAWWQESFNRLSLRAQAILIVPDLTEGTKWEIKQLLNETLRSKTLWLMPNMPASDWETVRREVAEHFGAKFPPFKRGFWIFALDEQLCSSALVGLALWMRAIDGAMSALGTEANVADGPQSLSSVWERCVQAQRHVEAHDVLVARRHYRARN